MVTGWGLSLAIPSATVGRFLRLRLAGTTEREEAQSELIWV
jgi:hypothetical protein